MKDISNPWSRILFDLFHFWILRKSLLVHKNFFPHQVGSAWTETQLTNVLGGDHWSMSSPKITKLTMDLDKGHWKIQISFMIMMTCHLQNSWLSDALTTQPTVCPLGIIIIIAIFANIILNYHNDHYHQSDATTIPPAVGTLGTTGRTCATSSLAEDSLGTGRVHLLYSGSPILTWNWKLARCPFNPLSHSFFLTWYGTLSKHVNSVFLDV